MKILFYADLSKKQFHIRESPEKKCSCTRMGVRKKFLSFKMERNLIGFSDKENEKNWFSIIEKIFFFIISDGK